MMKVQKNLIMIIILTSFLNLLAQDCASLQKDINNKKNEIIIQKITSVAIKYLETADSSQLRMLQCALNFVTSQSGIAKQIQDKGQLFEVIQYLLDHDRIIAQKNFSQLSLPKNFQEDLTDRGRLTNDLYVKYMKIIDKYTALKSATAALKPETILPGYEKYLQNYKNKSPKTNGDIITFLLTSKLITFDKNDPAKGPRSAQKLYDTLRRLELSLQEGNKKSRLDFFGNRKRSEQITLIDSIQSALRAVYGEFILYNTTLAPSFNAKIAITTETNSLVFASVALALNTIVQELANKVYAAHRK